MKCLLLFLMLAVGWLPARAEGPDDEYVRIYGLIQAGDKLDTAGQSSATSPKYLEAQTALQQFQKVYPDWNPKVVTFRLNYLASKILAAPAKAPGASTPPVVTPAPPTPLAPAPAAPTPPAPAGPSDQERQLAALQEDLRRLQADKSALEAKLKEALAAQPAALDPRELTKAQQQIRDLMKENDLLKASLPAEKPTAPAPDTKAAEGPRRALAEANRRLTEQTRRADALAAEKKILERRLESLAPATQDSAKLEDLRQALTAANHELATQTELTKKLASEKDTLLAQVKTLTANASAADVLRTENDRLKAQLVDTKSAAPLVTSTVNPPASHPADLARIKLLESERDELARKLDAANKELSGRKARAAAARMQELNNRIATLRARLEILEARAVPYTAEELALFKPPATQLAAAAPRAGKKPIKSLPSGVAGFVASAQRHFAAQEYDQAEADYLQILRRDENNAYTLANLAAIQLERGNLDEAEKNVTKALAGAPDDSYSLSILGNLKARQGQYDQALDALSRAAELNPQSPEIQNSLGLTLSHKGLRVPAETALRRAITLDPNYGSAHHNLAVIYARQQPPALELARWHYDKARAAGHPRNEELEKTLSEKGGGP